MRWIWHIFWTLLLLLAVGFLVLWISCRWWSFQYFDAPGGWIRSAVFVDDGFLMTCFWVPWSESSMIQPPGQPGFQPATDGRWWRDPELSPQPDFVFLGITFIRTSRAGVGMGLDWFYLPLAYVAALLTVPAWIQLGRWIFFPRRRYRRGSCQRCGYDLRGSTGVCPECGTQPAGTGTWEGSSISPGTEPQPQTGPRVDPEEAAIAPRRI